jgi:hypothetical protein
MLHWFEARVGVDLLTQHSQAAWDFVGSQPSACQALSTSQRWYERWCLPPGHRVVCPKIRFLASALRIPTCACNAASRAIARQAVADSDLLDNKFEYSPQRSCEAMALSWDPSWKRQELACKPWISEILLSAQIWLLLCHCIHYDLHAWLIAQ